MSKIMNWTKFSRLFASAFFTAALICFFAPAVSADTAKLDDKGVLTINAVETLSLDESTFGDLIETLPTPLEEDDPTWLTGITIKDGGTLTITSGTSINILKSENSSVIVEGTLSIVNDDNTTLYAYTKDEDNEDQEIPQTMGLDLNGGTLQIVAGNAEIFTLNAAVNLGTKGGTIDIAEDASLNVVSIDAGPAGDLTIKGGGTLEVKTISMSGTLELEAGTLHLLTGAEVGTLNSAAGTTINGLRNGEEENASLSVTGEGSVIKGTLENIGALMVGNKNMTAADLTIKGGQHTVESIAIQRNAVLDVQAGTSINLTNTNEEADKEFDDMKIYGTLRVSSASGTGIYKGDLPNPETSYITVAGQTDSSGKVVNGIVEIYASDDDPETQDMLDADTLNTQVLGVGKIRVEEGVTFESGYITFGDGGESKLTGAYVYVDGGGIYKAKDIDLGTGNLYVQEKTTMEFDSIKANGLVSEAETHITARGAAEFTAVELAGAYDAQDHNLTVTKGGHITGQITGVNNFKVGGSLFLTAEEGKTTISAETWEIDAKTYIRTVGGTTSGDYSKVLQIKDDADRAEVLDILEKSQTALYQADWTENTEEGTYLDLDLNVLGIDDYVCSYWNQRGGNANNIAALIEYLCDEFPAFREGLESLSHEQLQSTLRSAMAGELAGNAVRFALQQPGQSVFRHLDTVVPLRFPFSHVRGQVREGFNVWFNPYGQAENADSDGNTFDGYKMTRFGFHLGGDIELYNRALLGVLFSYSNPQVKNGLGKITAHDYAGGMYLRVPTAWAVVANLMVGFGNQSYTYKNSYYDSEYHGSSVFASAELTRPIPFYSYQVTPLVAFDYQSVDVDSFLVFDPVLGGVYVQPEDISQASLRLGVLGNFGRFRTRLQYTRQIAGEDSVSTRTAILGALSSVTEIRGTEWGKDWLNIGIGGELLTTRHWRLFADYNFDLGKQTTSHLGSLNAVLTW